MFPTGSCVSTCTPTGGAILGDTETFEAACLEKAGLWSTPHTGSQALSFPCFPSSMRWRSYSALHSLTTTRFCSSAWCQASMDWTLLYYEQNNYTHTLKHLAITFREIEQAHYPICPVKCNWKYRKKKLRNFWHFWKFWKLEIISQTGQRSWDPTNNMW